MAVLAAYPNLGCEGKEMKVGVEWGVYDDVYCELERFFVGLLGRHRLRLVLHDVYPSKI